MNIEQKVFPKQNVISIREKASLRDMGRIIGRLYKKARDAGLKPAGKIFTVYWEKPEDPDNVDYEICLPVEGSAEGVTETGGETCAFLRVKGSYKQFESAYAALSEYIKCNDLEVAAPPREVYVRGPLFGFVTFIPIMITDIYFPLKIAS